MNKFFHCIALLVIVFCCSVADAKIVTVDLDTRPDLWNRYVIIVGQVPEKTEGTDVRKVTIDRVLHGPWVKPGTSTPIKFNASPDTNLKSGEYVLILEYDAEQLIFGFNTLVVGQIRNYMPVKSAFDPEISDVQIVIDTAKISLPGLKWQRLDELEVQMKDRPVIFQYVIQAKGNIVKATLSNYSDSLFRIADHHDDYPLRTVILADQLLVNLQNSIQFNWQNSSQRKDMFVALSQEVNGDAQSGSYIDEVVKSFAGATK